MSRFFYSAKKFFVFRQPFGIGVYYIIIKTPPGRLKSRNPAAKKDSEGQS